MILQQIMVWMIQVLFALSLLTADAATPASAITELKLATWNVFYRNTNVAEVVEIIRRIQPDILALQETTPRIERELKAGLSVMLPYHSFVTEPGSGGCGIMSRWPLGRLDYIAPTGSFRGSLTGVVRLAGVDGQSNEVAFAIVHLSTPRVGRIRSLTSALGALGQSANEHAEEIKPIYAKVAHADRAVIVGDFNSFSFSSAQAFLKQEHWQDSLLAVDAEADRRITWRGSEATGNIGGRIDYIFHNPNLETLESGVIAQGASDHFPVWSRIRVRPARGK